MQLELLEKPEDEGSETVGARAWTWTIVRRQTEDEPDDEENGDEAPEHEPAQVGQNSLPHVGFAAPPRSPAGRFFKTLFHLHACVVLLMCDCLLSIALFGLNLDVVGVLRSRRSNRNNHSNRGQTRIAIEIGQDIQQTLHHNGQLRDDEVGADNESTASR
ncbi:hypothetical protein EDC01DRAFT_781037 [Geopyxis carbonaria]|nr:hypothetical protein EDC01DRAFT_781037 [Geopyxis carbonaria]